MSDETLLLVGFTALGAVAVVFAVAWQIVAETGLRTFIWPRVDHSYVIPYALRLAVAPWYLIFLFLLLNGLSILLFERDVSGARAEGGGYWLAACIVPMGMAHLIDGRRSRLAAFLSLVVLLALTAAAAWLARSWLPAIAAPFLLWALNGVRATIADHS
jgi:hypothetical protein